MSFPEHILVVNVYFAPYSYGGATVVAEEVARELVHHHGRRVSAISVMTLPDLEPYMVMRTEKDGVQNYLINLPHHRSYTELYTNPRVDEILSDLLDKLRPDLVHAHCLQEIGAGLVGQTRARGLPTVLSVHDFWWLCEYQFMIRPNLRYCGQDPVRIEDCRGCVSNLERARLRHDTLLAAAARADLITFPSHFALDLSVRSGLTAARTAVWENGVRLPGPDFFEAHTRRRMCDPRLVFGYLGGPAHIKGGPLVKAAFEQLTRDDFAGILVDASLDSSWWQARDIVHMKGDWQIRPRFDQDEMDDFYAGIDVLLFPSQWKETFGLAIREALARGIAVLQTDGGGTSEWEGAQPETMLRIGDGPEVLRARIENMLENPPAPLTLRLPVSHADQARALLSLVAPLAPKGAK